MNTKSEREFDRYRDIYGSSIDDAVGFSGQGHEFYLQLKAEHLLAAIRDKFGNEQSVKVLDVGCGHGLMHPFMQEQNIDLIGCDPAASVIEQARQQNPDVNYLSNDGAVLPFNDNTFDVAFTVCVMHHVPPDQWPDFLKEMQRVVRPGGLLMVYEHNPNNPLTMRIVNNCELDKDAVLLRSKKLSALMRDIAPRRIRREFIIFFPFRGRLFRAIERLLTWLPLGAQYVISAELQ